jgi:amino acid adenylation domain-containing protein
MASSASEDAPLTHSQTQIWVGQRLDPESPLYNMTFAFVLEEELETDVFCEAWRRVVDGSEALRTRVVEQPDGSIGRSVQPTGRETETLDFESDPEPEKAFQRWCEERCSRALPLDGPLVDSVIVRLGGGRTGWYLNQHHLITDAWSTQLLYREVSLEYAALLGGGSSEPTPRVDYYPTALALQARSEVRDEAEEHWAQRRDHPGRSVPLYGRSSQLEETASTRWTLELDEERSRNLERLCQLEGFVSPFEELSRFGVFATLLVSWLHRISSSHEIGFDSPVAGRPTQAAKRALGLFIEMFPFAARIEPDDTFRSIGARCLAEAKLFLRHALPGLSSPSSAAASNVVLNYVPHAFGEFAGIPAEVEWVHPGHGDKVHALRLQVHDFSGSGRYTLHFDFNRQALPERLQRRGLEHFEILLEAMLDDPDQPIAAVDLLVDEERRALASLNDTDSAPLPERSAVAMFRAQAELEPDRVALRQGAQEISFATLREQSETLAAALLETGAEPGDRVVIVSRRSGLAVAAILGTLQARCAFVPVDANTPPARLHEIVEDSGARVLLLGDAPGFDADATDVKVVRVEESLRSGAVLPADHATPALDDLAYLIYTSGSTGRPKGVLIEHGGLADYLCWAERQYVRGERLVYPLFTSLAFDLTVTSLFLPLVTGGTLEIYPEPEGPVDSALIEVVEANAVDFIKLTPSHLALLRGMGCEGSRLRRMVVGGENFRTELAASISSQFQDQLELYNEYGPTEAVVGCLVHRYDPEKDTDASVPIGVPADHVTVEILNDAQSPVPEGAPGELWISRYGLARGYHGLEAATRASFQPNPHRPGENRYRSGDLVRMVDASTIEYLGRLDRQLKVAGFRIEPGEIETALLSTPHIEQCAVITRRHAASELDSQRAHHHCIRCGLPSNYPRAAFDESGVCSICRSYEAIKDRAQAYFKSEDELRRIFDESARRHRPKYDCLMLYSGGKDSSYAICRLVDMGLSVYAFTLDNGFIAEGAKENIRRVTQQLGVPVELATTPAMNAIFRDSLMRFSNVCNGCFKAIYTLSMRRAHDLGIPIIVTGLSRGQMFETRLTEEMFRDGRHSPDEVDAAVLAARKVYHRVSDEVTRSLNASLFEDDEIFEAIQFVDFFRYVDVGLDEMYSYLRQRVTWVRPEDTGRSTNCLINDLGIHIHQQERGYHNYALPYSWDVRLGHKTREEALEELDDDIDEMYIEETLEAIGYDDQNVSAGTGQTSLEAFVVASETISEADVLRELGERLPPYLIPTHLHQVDSIPLRPSGKVDEEALRSQIYGRQTDTPFREPEGPVEEFLTHVWQLELGLERVGADDDFFELGGTSLGAMQVMLQLCREFDLDLPLETMFSHSSLGRLARAAEDRILADAAELAEGGSQRRAEEVEPPS